MPHQLPGSAQLPFVILHGGEVVPELLAAWAASSGHHALRVADAEALARLLSHGRPAGGALVATPEVMAAWAHAWPDGPPPWLIVDHPDVEALVRALAAAPAGIIAAPPAGLLVEGLAPAPADPAAWLPLVARARHEAGPQPAGLHGAWITACLAAGEAYPPGQALLVPIVVEHLQQHALQLALHEDQGPRALALEPTLAAIALRWAVSASKHGVHLALGPTQGSLTAVPAPFLHVLDTAVGLLCDALPSGGRLTLSGDAAGIHLRRQPTAATEPDRLAAGAIAALLDAARAAGAHLALDGEPWPTITLSTGAAAHPAVPHGCPTVTLLEPDPLLRAWAQGLPGGHGVATPPWSLGGALPAQALVPGAWVLVDDRQLETVRRLLPPGAVVIPLPLRATFGAGGLAFPAFQGAAPAQTAHDRAPHQGPGEGGDQPFPAPHRPAGAHHAVHATSHDEPWGLRMVAWLLLAAAFGIWVLWQLLTWFQSSVL